MPITVDVTRFRHDPLDPRRILRAAYRAQMEYANAISDSYMDTVADWSTEHGEKSATPKIIENSATVRRINIYIRGPMAAIYVNIDQGFMRKISILADYKPKTTPGVISSRPGGRKGGGQVTGRLLRKPIPVVARRFTESIAEAARTGNLISVSGTLGDNVRQALRRMFDEVGVSKTIGRGRNRYRKAR